MFERNAGSKKGEKALRCIAIIAGMMLFSASLFSAFYIASETGHDCCGEGCPICAHIDQCEAIVRNTGDGAAILGVSFLFAVFFTVAAPACDRVFRWSSLITHKVRMNN